MDFQCIFLGWEAVVKMFYHAGYSQHVGYTVTEDRGEERTLVWSKITGQISCPHSVDENEPHQPTQISTVRHSQLFGSTVTSNLIRERSRCSPKSKWEVRKAFLKEVASEGIHCWLLWTECLSPPVIDMLQP